MQGYGKVTINDRFLKQVIVEGFGKIKEGWYISYWTIGPQWYRTETDKGPLNELGNKRVAGQTVAVDPKIISSQNLQFQLYPLRETPKALLQQMLAMQ